MAIISIDTSQVGQVGVLPSYASINTNDTEAAVLTTGYLNKEVANGATFALPCIAKVTTQSSPSAAPVVGWYNVAHVPPNWSLTPTTSPGGVRLPVVAGHFAQFVDILGTIGDDNLVPSSAGFTTVTMFNSVRTPIVNNLAAFADSNGSIQQLIPGGTAGVQGNLFLGLGTGVPGILLAYPALANAGAFLFSATSNGSGNFESTITNGSVGQGTTYHLTDPGVSNTNFLLSDSGSGQVINSGRFQVANGQIIAGSASGSVAVPQPGFLAYSPTSAHGSLVLQVADISSNTQLTITNASTFGQNTTYNLIDPGVASATFLLSDNPGNQFINTGALEITNGNLYIGNNVSTGSGFLQIFPTTPFNGSMIVRAQANAGNVAAGLANSPTLAQTTLYVLSDSTSSNATVAITTSALVANNLVMATNTTGELLDTGINYLNVQPKSNLFGSSSLNIGGAGAGPIFVGQPGLIIGSPVVATVQSSSNPVSVIAAVAAANGFNITFSADPGASCIINYIAMIHVQT